MSSTTAPSDRAAQRRAARRADNRADILDAAERVFATHGIQAGSVRKIGAESGFSAAAIYLFFDSKQQLLLETLGRRGVELVAAVGAAAADGSDALDALHRVIDVAVDYFETHPEFSQIVHQLRGGVSAGPALGDPGDSSGLIDRATAWSRTSSGAVRRQARSGPATPGPSPTSTRSSSTSTSSSRRPTTRTPPTSPGPSSTTSSTVPCARPPGEIRAIPLALAPTDTGVLPHDRGLLLPAPGGPRLAAGGARPQPDQDVRRRRGAGDRARRRHARPRRGRVHRRSWARAARASRR